MLCGGGRVCVFLGVRVFCLWQCVLNLMACFLVRWCMRTHSLSNLHIKRAALFANCHKAVLSITHHSRETQMALTRSTSPANWGITGVSVVPITLVTACQFIAQWISPCNSFCRCNENKAKWPG